jgi:hypothetical protein
MEGRGPLLQLKLQLPLSELKLELKYNILNRGMPKDLKGKQAESESDYDEEIEESEGSEDY